MLKKKPKETLPELNDPGDDEPEFCAPGSIEQQLDMCDEGTLRGEDVIRHWMPVEEEQGHHPLDPDEMLENYHVDMAELDREGDEMSGDEHSSGYQGGEQELIWDLHTPSGLPGDQTRIEELSLRSPPPPVEMNPRPAKAAQKQRANHRTKRKAKKTKKRA